MNIVNGLPQSTVVSHESIRVTASGWQSRSGGIFIYDIPKEGLHSNDVVFVAPDARESSKEIREMIAESMIHAEVENGHIVLVADGPKPTKNFRVVVTILD